MSDSPATPPTSGLARASLACGIAGLLFPILIPSIIAIILGHKASVKIKAADGKLEGSSMALGGIISGIIGIVIIVMFIGVYAMLMSQKKNQTDALPNRAIPQQQLQAE